MINGPSESRSVPSHTQRATTLPLPPGSATLAFGEAEFLTAAQRCVDEAEASVLIVVAAIDGESVKGWEPQLKEALKRGVRVDVLWGTADPDGDGLSELKRIAFQTAAGPVRALRFNTRPAGIVSQIVVADRSADGADVVTAILGGVPLLHKDAGKDHALPALRVSHAGVVAQIARAAAGWWAQTAGEDFSASIDRWRRLASGWEESIRSPRPSPARPPSPAGSTWIRLESSWMPTAPCWSTSRAGATA